MKEKNEQKLSSLENKVIVNDNEEINKEIVIDGNKFKIKRHFVNDNTTVLDCVMELILDYIKQINEESSG